ncbi:MAG TPA: superoxide dismutase family protein [Rhodanobacteraceae bacterium]|nr:superoxide dismutase family protein [Rhodanobacteraceae bacterium]
MKTSGSLAVVATLALLAGCSTVDGDVAASPDADASAHAHAVLAPASGSDVQGRLSLVGTDYGVRITGQITGLEPGSTHGFHIHQNGDCSAPDASSAGGHFNPAHQPHGRAGVTPHHAGDIANQTANDEGVATVDVTVQDIELGTGGPGDVLGRAIVVHAQPDDYTSQPSGDAGARIACGVITRD